MGSLISLDIELNAIKSFLKTVINAADTEYSRIKIKSDSCEFSHYDDEANALFIPMQWEEIAIKATLGELNALVEWELYNLANKPFFEKGYASKKGRFKMVYDLRFNEIIELIEDHYKIKLSDLDDYKQINLIRNKVNSFKHRKGFKDPRSDDFNRIVEKNEVSKKEAFQSIDSVRSFLKKLWNKTKTKKGITRGHSANCR